MLNFPTYFCCEITFVVNLRTFKWKISWPQIAVVLKKWQISGMRSVLFWCRFHCLFTFCYLQFRLLIVLSWAQGWYNEVGLFDSSNINLFAWVPSQNYVFLSVDVSKTSKSYSWRKGKVEIAGLARQQVTTPRSFLKHLLLVRVYWWSHFCDS